ncbi:hypothetical protein PACTADRAFT_50226, partial [Pachysolen tannophilus NRRL Y-2460]
MMKKKVPYLYNVSKEIPSSHDIAINHTHKSLPKDVKKYWKNRYSLFKKFDSGIELTTELWYSVTPEDIALFTAKFLKYCYPDDTKILDLFCGGGGNTIQFGRFFSKIYALDYNEINLQCTLNNCQIYKINSKKIIPLHCDFKSAVKDENFMNFCHDNIDIIYSSPPWGGPSYTNDEVFDLNDLKPFGFEELLTYCLKISNKVVFFLPRNSNLKQLSAINRKLKIENSRVIYMKLQGRIKGISVFYGDNFL